MAALLLAGLDGSLAFAADTLELFDPGMSDFEFYLSVNGMGKEDAARTLGGEFLLGAGLTDRVSGQVFGFGEANHALAEGTGGIGFGLFATPVDRNHFDLDVGLNLTVESADSGDLEVISEFNPPPESIPINSLMPMPGTPLEDADPVSSFDVIRVIALTRIASPKSRVRLSAGRAILSEEAQALCFFAGANSIFYGEKLLTTNNPEVVRDQKLLATLGLDTQESNPDLKAPEPAADRPLSPEPAVRA